MRYPGRSFRSASSLLRYPETKRRRSSWIRFRPIRTRVNDKQTTHERAYSPSGVSGSSESGSTISLHRGVAHITSTGCFRSSSRLLRNPKILYKCVVALKAKWLDEVGGPQSGHTLYCGYFGTTLPMPWSWSRDPGTPTRLRHHSRPRNLRW